MEYNIIMFPIECNKKSTIHKFKEYLTIFSDKMCFI